MKLQGLSPSHITPGGSWGLLAIQGLLLPHLPHPGAGDTAEVEAIPLRAAPACLHSAVLPQRVGRSLNLPMQNPQQTNIDFTTTSRSEAWLLGNRSSDGSRKQKAPKHPETRGGTSLGHQPVPPLVTCSDWPHTEELDCRQQQKY